MIHNFNRLFIFPLIIFALVGCSSSNRETGDFGNSDTSSDESAGPIDESDIGNGSEAGATESEAQDSQASDQAAADSDELEPIDEANQVEANQDEAKEDNDLENELDKNQMADESSQAAVDNGAEDGALDAPPEPATPATPPPPEPVAIERARVNSIRFVANNDGGTVVIETSKPVMFQSRMNSATNQFIVEMADTDLPSDQQKAMVVSAAGARFAGMNAYQGSGQSTTRVVIQMKQASSEIPMIQQEGASLIVVPPAPPLTQPPVAPVLAQKTSEPVESDKPAGALSAKTLDEFLTGNQKFYGKAISLQVRDADVRDVVNFIAEDSGANIVMSDDVGGKISLKLRKVPWDQALVTIMRSKSLGYIRQGNVLRISTLKSLEDEAAAANKLMESNKSIAPSVIQAIPVSYAKMDDLLLNVKPFLTPVTGQAVADARTNTLIVTDKAEAVDRIVKVVKTLDVVPTQVSIESKIVEAVEGFENFVGVNWTMSGAPVNLSSGGGANGASVDLRGNLASRNFSAEFAGGSPFTAGLQIGTLDIFGDLGATLALAESNSLAKVITAPRISTMNREKSTITQSGENVVVATTRVEQTGVITKTPVRTPFSLELTVTPQITTDGAVIMDLNVKREFLGALVDAETKARSINKRAVQTKILVRNGQTAVIGGIYSSDELEATNGVPGLMSIPVIGWLFKNRSQERTKNELLIFMTPRILVGEAAAPTAVPSGVL